MCHTYGYYGMEGSKWSVSALMKLWWRVADFGLMCKCACTRACIYAHASYNPSAGEKEDTD